VVHEEGDFVGGVSAEIDQEACTQCGKCKEVCRFEAVQVDSAGHYVIDSTACEGCGTCAIVCPDLAIATEDDVNGRWFVSNTRFGPMAHAALGPAQENSGKLVSLVRELAAGLTPIDPPHGGTGGVLIDGSPGTGCPVIASITAARYAVVVTEPTVSGLHDLLRVMDVTRHFRVDTGVIVNKADLNTDVSERIQAEAEHWGAHVLGQIPYEPRFTQAQIQRKTLLEYADCEAAQLIRNIWNSLERSVLETGTGSRV
jgi:MinD superfamily P-loop ATPase